VVTDAEQTKSPTPSSVKKSFPKTSSGPPATASPTADTPLSIRTGSIVRRTTPRKGASAVGCWSWSAATASNDWFVSGAFSRDYAIIALQHSGTVKNADVATVTGGLGFAWNWGRDQAWFFLGYHSPFTGGKIIATASEHRYDDSSQGNPPTNSWGSNQPPGASGSPAVAISTLTQATSTRVRAKAESW
jgi:hypothetical protein